MSPTRRLIMNPEGIADYYSSGGIAGKMAAFAAGREVAGRTSTGAYLSRPNILAYPNDVVRMVGEGAVSLHGSVELWSNPMGLSAGLARSELDRLRVGWDFIIDIDSNFLEYSKATCDKLVKALLAHGIKSISVKFSGRAGFHIAVPFEAFPPAVNGKPTSTQFPELPRTLAGYLGEFVRDSLLKELRIIAKSPEHLVKKTEESGDSEENIKSRKLIDEDGSFRPDNRSKRERQIFSNEDGSPRPIPDALKLEIKDDSLNPYDLYGVGLDTILISPRHLVRLPYSLNEKTWLVSLPIEPSKVREFDKETARPSAVAASSNRLMDYCPRETASAGEAAELVELAFSFFSKKRQPSLRQEEVKKTPASFEAGQITEEHFPPCIKGLLLGLGDGRKRAEFVLRTFLRRGGWDWPAIEALLLEWNRKKNKEPLPDGYITSHIAWHRKQDRGIMPPNCDSAAFYKELGVCTPERFCNGAKNPIVVALRKSRIPAIKEKIPTIKGKTDTTNKKQKLPPPPPEP